MTEREWLEGTDPNTMLDFAHQRTTDRKRRLFACACCRRIWEHLKDENSRRAVEAAEAYAEGEIEEGRLRVAHQAAKGYLRSQQSTDESVAAMAAAEAAIQRDPFGPDRAHVDIGFPRGYPRMTPSQVVVLCLAQRIYYASKSQEWRAEVSREQADLCRLLRETVGNPFRPVALKPGWLTPTVLGLATAAYEERTLPAGTLEPGRFAVLSDALEEAGCDDAEVLSHLREPGAHVRGCWVVDLLLGKG